MSIWTHVAGIIRVDAILNLTEKPIYSYNVPCGSEGSLDVSLWENPHSSDLAKYTISIFGDLRDYDDEEEIIDYFTRITKGQMIRQACFTLEVEGATPRTFIWDEKGFIEQKNKEVI